MTRHNPAGFYVIPPDEKGYPGMTELKREDGSTVQALGVGPEVEAVLRRSGKATIEKV